MFCSIFFTFKTRIKQMSAPTSIGYSIQYVSSNPYVFTNVLGTIQIAVNYGPDTFVVTSLEFNDNSFLSYLSEIGVTTAPYSFTLEIYDPVTSTAAESIPLSLVGNFTFNVQTQIWSLSAPITLSITPSSNLYVFSFAPNVFEFVGVSPSPAVQSYPYLPVPTEVTGGTYNLAILGIFGVILLTLAIFLYFPKAPGPRT